MSDSRLDVLLEETGLPQWANDLLLIAGFVLATYVFFGILGVLTGVSTNEIVGTLQSITFFGAVFALVALALNLHWGYTGLFNIGVAGFMAVGVYTMAILTASPDASPAGLGLPIWVGIIGGMVAAALVGLVAGLPALRVRADYFAIVTLGLAEIIRLALLSGSLRTVEIGGTEYGTGGGSGIRYTPVDSVVGWVLDLQLPVLDWAFGQLFAAAQILGIQPSIVENALYTAVLIAFVIAFYVFLSRIANSPFGRVLKAIREDELATRSLGKNTDRVKLIVFMVGCSLMGLAGILWMGSRSFVSPDSFMPIVTFYVFVALIVGGSGSNTGSVIGGFAFAAFLYEGPRFIRAIVRANADVRSPATVYDAFVAIGSGDVMPMVGYVVGSLDEIRFILVGVVLVLLMLWKPDGLLGHRTEIAAATDLSRRPATTDGATATDGGETDE
ncbi:branched-chain amino acid ABC transporter permease [Natrarchaeobaculum aegyptiacum]|uniref:Branched-chain amino acid ABC transporter permease n=1 Tax=Natrarchaeobaculum aegyptiacum TaxID=745377 RepID=A0A2Z2HNC1_9EURY|nr:branched-chain amino acid ABC transporter permease [Natrarchaeobaculum aegyptiacum]ARS88362.1 branched-chain amino acid ABC transporter permease [Natrarchaeobaculum aegyptiacum]